MTCGLNSGTFCESWAMLDPSIGKLLEKDDSREVPSTAQNPKPTVRELLETLRPFVFALEGKVASGDGKISCEISANDVLRARRFFSQQDMQVEQGRAGFHFSTLGEDR